MPDPDEHPRPGENTKANIPTELHQISRAAVRIVERATGRRYTLAQFLREAITAQINLIARDYNDGNEILPDSRPLERGRP